MTILACQYTLSCWGFVLFFPKPGFKTPWIQKRLNLKSDIIRENLQELIIA